MPILSTFDRGLVSFADDAASCGRVKAKLAVAALRVINSGRPFAFSGLVADSANLSKMVESRCGAAVVG